MTMGQILFMLEKCLQKSLSGLVKVVLVTTYSYVSNDVPAVVGISPHSDEMAPTQAKIATTISHNLIQIHF